MNNTISYLYVPIDDFKLAKQIAKALIENKLAACVNVIPDMLSFYYFEDKIQEDREVLMLIKTQSAMIEGVRKAVKALHSYEIPALIEIEAKSVNKEFLDWVLNKD